MAEALQAFLENLVKSILEVEARAQVLAVGLRLLEGVRKLVLLHHLQMVACILCALGLFGAGFAAASAWPLAGIHSLPIVFFYSLGVFVVSGGYLAYACSSRTWVAAFRLEEQINAAVTFRRSAPPAAAVDPEQLAALIEKIVDKRIAARDQGEQADEPTPKTRASKKPHAT